MGSSRQFRLLLWKNWLLQKRKIALTVFEILLPTLFVLILLLIKQRVETTPVAEPSTWPSFTVGDVLPSRLQPPGGPRAKWVVPFSPDIPVVRRVMARVGARLNVIPRGYATADEFLAYWRTEAESTYGVLGAVTFEENFADNETMNEGITYRVRMTAEQYGRSGGGVRFVRASSWWTSGMYSASLQVGPRNNGSVDGGSPGYHREGFLHVQRAVDLAITRELNQTAETEDIETQLKRFPYPPYVSDPFVAVLQRQFPFIVLLSFIIIAPNICKDIVLEKERKLKETMKMMGLKNYLHWCAWFVKYLIFAFVITFIMTLFLHLNPGGRGAIINYSHPTVTFVFLFLYAVATIMFCFAISTFCSKASAGAAAGAIVYLLTYVPYFFLSFRYEEMTSGQKAGACVLHNLAMAFGCVQLSMFEGAGIGLQWNNLNTPVNNDDKFTMMYVMLLLVMDIIIYGIITWYFDAILPGDFGIPKPPYFPFTKWYWCGKEVEPSADDDGGFDTGDRGDFFESKPPGMRAGIQIRKLRKEFTRGGSTKAAVNDLDMDMYEGQITALLGHNGAGKTTTMFMLTGFMPPTSGTATINGYDIRRDIDKVRESLGLCPQHDVLFDTMTVEEHLIFFAELKGLKGDEVQKQVDKMITLTHLEDKAHAPANSLSGGMKRKLSVSIALIADSKIVILDEPTSGMDPEARRQTWDILQNERHGRTMILTTHFMDEADLLGDRIAIMANGSVQCCGSSLFLKSKYGVGYHMVMVKTPSCDVSNVTGIIRKYVPEAELESNISAELSFLLPKESSDRFEHLFTYLEENKDSLGISSFGASVTTLEEVFLKVGEDLDADLAKRLQRGSGVTPDQPQGVQNGGFANDEGSTPEIADGKARTAKPETLIAWEAPQQESKNHNFKGETTEENGHVGVEVRANGAHEYQLNDFKSSGSRGVSPSEIQLKPTFGVTFNRNTGVKYNTQQFRAMFEKRVLHSRRNILVTCVQVIVPLFFTILACVVLRTLPGPRDPPPMTLDLSSFTDPQVAYIGLNATGDDFAEGIKEGFLGAVSGRGDALDVAASMRNNPDLDQFLINVSEYNFERYFQDYMIAGSFIGKGVSSLNRSTVTIAHFNNQAYHATGISLSFVQNAVLKFFAGGQYNITTINHPLPRRSTTQATDELNTGFVVSFIVSWCVSFGMAFLVATFVVFLIKERVTKSKHIQYVSGTHVGNFWTATFLWDLINYLVPALLLIAVFAGFGIDAFYKGANGGYMFLIFLLYAWAVLPFVYLLSFAFDVPSSGYVWITVLNIFTGTATVLAVIILKYPELDTEQVAYALEWIFYVILPNFCFSNSMNDLYTNHQGITLCGGIFEEIGIDKETFCELTGLLNATNPCCVHDPVLCGSNCANYNENYLAWESPGIGRGVCFMALQGAIFFFILILMESGTCRRACSKAASGSYASSREDDAAVEISMTSLNRTAEEDNDVRAERKRITETPVDELMKDNSLILTELKKYYGNFLAVDRLSVGIPQGECFGLLGVNGAGKTTTFKMMTGDEMVSSGEAFLSGFSVKDDMKEVQKKLGYCPQFDALIDQMTVRETLKMFGRLRGIDESDVDRVVDKLIHSLLLSDHSDKQAGRLSGGNKRKLSTAIALIGDPPIIFLDEPTTGMDPVARRLLWDTLTKVRASGRTLVLTSHSMEECEALCTRMAIMVNGQFKCLGSTQHLKTKFGEGYTLIAKIRSSASEKSEVADLETQTAALKNFIEKQFSGCELKDAHIGLVHYQIRNDGVTWAGLFGTMERAKIEYNIEDYSVSQTTLEQVFINFARAQVDPRDTSMSCKIKCTNCCQFFCCKCCCK